MVPDFNTLNASIDEVSKKINAGDLSPTETLTNQMQAYLGSNPARDELIALGEKIFALRNAHPDLQALAQRIDAHLFPIPADAFHPWEDEKMLIELQKEILSRAQIGFPKVSKKFEGLLCSMQNPNEVFQVESQKYGFESNLENTIEHALRFKFPKISFQHGDPSGALLLRLVKNAPHLKELMTRCCSLTSLEMLDLLKNCQQLESLELVFPKLSSDCFKELAKLSNLKHLAIHCCYDGDEDDFALLSQLKHLQDLDLSNCRIDDSKIKTLHLLPNLKKLDLRDSAITDEALEAIAKITSLENITLSSPEITDKDLPLLLNLTNLKRIDLTFCPKISVEALKTLASLPNIQEIQVYGCNRIPAETSLVGIAPSHVKIVIEDLD